MRGCPVAGFDVCCLACCARSEAVECCRVREGASDEEGGTKRTLVVAVCAGPDTSGGFFCLFSTITRQLITFIKTYGLRNSLLHTPEDEHISHLGLSSTRTQRDADPHQTRPREVALIPRTAQPFIY